MSWSCFSIPPTPNLVWTLGGVQLRAPEALLWRAATGSERLQLRRGRVHTRRRCHPGAWSWVNISSQERCRGGASAQPHSGTSRALGWGPARGCQPPGSPPAAGHVLAKPAPRQPGRDVLVPFPSRVGTARKAVCRRGQGMRQPAIIPWPGWRARGAPGGLARWEKGCLFLGKAAEGCGGTFFPPVNPPLSPHHPTEMRQAGVSVLGSHVLPLPPTRACRGRS